VSLLEVVVSWSVDERKWSRKKSVWLIGLITFVVGIPSALSQGAVSALGGAEFSILGQGSFLDLMNHLWGTISLALGGLLTCVFVGWVWKSQGPTAELRSGSQVSDGAVKVWWFAIKYVCPVVIFIVLLNIFGVFGSIEG
jgi:NSS family neurotransmitter:Na+ symporter